jgi:pilus assembly protein CpaC
LKSLVLKVLWAALVLTPLVAQIPARAAGGEGPRTIMSVEAGTGRVLTLASPVANIFVADPKVAEVRPASPTSLFVFGLNPGRTTIAVMDADGQLLVQYELTVQPSSFSAHEAQNAINRLLPGNRVKVHSQGKGLMLSGSVRSPADAAQIMAIAKGYVADGALLDNEITVESPIQVTLNVRIAQMSRNVVRNLGINWSALSSFGSIGKLPAVSLNANGSPSLACLAGAIATSGVGALACSGLGFTGVIDALAKDNLAHILAEPNLTVISGQSASFQAGGEYPIPTTQGNGSIGITYKSFGVLLSFLPTVLSDGRINLHVKPEVSETSTVNSVQVNSANGVLNIPSLTIRRAETTVELGSGESFAIAGMLQQNTNDTGSGIPGLGDIPYAGALFRDSNFNRTETELVIVVTPYIVRPVSNPSALRLPTDGYTPPPEIERLLLMRQVSKQRPPVPVSIPGSAGFIVQ